MNGLDRFELGEPRTAADRERKRDIGLYYAGQQVLLNHDMTIQNGGPTSISKPSISLPDYLER